MTDAKQTALSAAASLALQHRTYQYRINGDRIISMTPERALWYAERYDADVQPLTDAPIAAEGALEASYGLAAERVS